MIVVIGGGLSGLAAALTVQERGQQVHLIEGNENVGGRLATERIDGFTIDRGFQVINPGYRE
ncbi:MAG: FAD-dependent oxidoreductase, partial [Actinobacteria bacterium]|nr:FAD-dependent oxidoreductase [Actinomycetota bacterium]